VVIWVGMSAPLLATKLYAPPPRSDLVSRPRLIERLDEGMRLGHRITLVSASAGSGKTTLLSEWAAGRQELIAWLSLDEDDNDAPRFWAYVIAALQKAQPGIGEGASALLQAAQIPPARLLLTGLINDLAELPRRIILILDDYHLVTEASIHELLAFLLEHMPEQLHVVIASRADPPLPVARLRAGGQLTELRASDLRFNAQEAATFLNDVCGLGLAGDDVAALEARTEGWAAGLSLAALSMKGREDRHAVVQAFGGSHQYVIEYLIEEVLSQQPEAVESFLIRTSILDRLCGPLGDAVSGDRQRAETLALLERDNLFVIPLDDEQRWYRYHHLFRDLLRKRLGQTLQHNQIQDLHRRAAEWLERAGLLNEAVKHARTAEDFDRVARIAEQAAAGGQLDARLTTLLRWVDTLPEDVLGARPRLQVYRAWALFMNGHLGPAQQALQECRKSLEALPPAPDSEPLRDELTRLLDTIDRTARAFFAAFDNQLGAAVEAATQARETALADGHILLAVEATEALALAQYHRGKLQDSAASCRAVIDLAKQTPLAAAGHVELAGVHIERHELDEAERLLDNAVELSLGVGATQTLNEAYTAMSRLRQARGDSEGAWEALREAAEVSSVEGSHSMANFRWAAQRARLQLDAGEPEKVLRWVEGTKAVFAPGDDAAGEDRVTLPSAFMQALETLRARALIARGEPEGALESLRSLLGLHEASGAYTFVIEIRALMALALDAQGEREAALDSLKRALALAAPEGFIRVFVSEGPAMARLLREAASGSIEPDYVERLLAEFGPASAGSPVADSLVEQLTPREFEVLILIGRGYSNQEIADELVIALNTVKRHCSSIYGKLAVRSRTQAVARARELGLLSSTQPE